jgi:hypothetical protein
MQHDVQEFNRVLQDKLESKMKVRDMRILLEYLSDNLVRALQRRVLSIAFSLAR